MSPPMGSGQIWRRAIGMLAIAWLAMGCSKDMQEQPSYHPQEAPRLHSPAASVPRESRAIAPPFSSLPQRHVERGARLFAVNCTHCHGPKGEGDGPVAGYLKELPANLHAARIQKKSAAELYEVVTNGKDAMPPFRGELSAEERWIVASFIKTFTTEGGANSIEDNHASPPPPRKDLPRRP
jgi:mono/diheme cytochrome c family protein